MFLTFVILFLPMSYFADDGSLKLDTDIITNSVQETTTNRIEAKYAPNLFLNRTQKVIQEKTKTTKELLQGAEQIAFKDKKDYSIYQLKTQSIKSSLFHRYKIEENFSAVRVRNKSFEEVIGNLLTGLFLLAMVLLGTFLGRKWHGLRKNRTDNSV